MTRVNVGIVTAYNDLLSAHQPYMNIIRADQSGAVCPQVTALRSCGRRSGHVRWCHARSGWHGSAVFSRDVIAQSTAVSLSHNAFDATLLLGICDKDRPRSADRRSLIWSSANRICACRPDEHWHQ